MQSSCRAFLFAFCGWLILAPLAGVADGRIKVPSIAELIDSADVIVIGQVESSRPPPAVFWRNVPMGALLIASIALVALLLRKRSYALAACVGVGYLMILMLYPVPYGTYRKLARVSVASLIKGTPPPKHISVLYDEQGFVCDRTELQVGRDYVLFLKHAPSGYVPSWYQWSVWAVETGPVQAERRMSHGATSISIGDLLQQIRGLWQDKPEAVDEPSPDAP